MKTLIARLWRAMAGPLQWRILWIRHAKFMVGVTAVIRNDQGQVLLLKHRLWPEGRQWGCPTGYANKGETFPATIARELREETGLAVEVGPLVNLTSGYKLRVEVAYECKAVGGTLQLDPLEILEARWFSPDTLPEGMQESHRLLIHGKQD
jgi:ADP-ribose pyrophosphatase YjhB (NUDIX family)